MIPTVASEAALYDLMRERFGIGDYDEGDPSVPWWKARNTEIGKLKAQMRRRRLTIEDLSIAIWYADREGHPIAAIWQLGDLVAIAKKAYRAESNPGSDLRERLNQAAYLAYERGDQGWASRLYAADLSTGALVLQQWAEHMEKTR